VPPSILIVNYAAGVRRLGANVATNILQCGDALLGQHSVPQITPVEAGQEPLAVLQI